MYRSAIEDAFRNPQSHNIILTSSIDDSDRPGYKIPVSTSRNDVLNVLERELARLIGVTLVLRISGHRSGEQEEVRSWRNSIFTAEPGPTHKYLTIPGFSQHAKSFKTEEFKFPNSVSFRSMHIHSTISVTLNKYIPLELRCN